MITHDYSPSFIGQVIKATLDSALPSGDVVVLKRPGWRFGLLADYYIIDAEEEDGTPDIVILVVPRCGDSYHTVMSRADTVEKILTAKGIKAEAEGSVVHVTGGTVTF